MDEPIIVTRIDMTLGSEDRIYVERKGHTYALCVEDERGHLKHSITMSRQVALAFARSVTGITLEADNPCVVTIGPDAQIRLSEKGDHLVVTAVGVEFRINVCPEKLRLFRAAVDALRPKA